MMASVNSQIFLSVNIVWFFTVVSEIEVNGCLES